MGPQSFLSRSFLAWLFLNHNFLSKQIHHFWRQCRIEVR